MSTIDSAKAAMGYTQAKQRPACNNCRHMHKRESAHFTWWCELGGFFTTAMAICEQYAPVVTEARR